MVATATALWLGSPASVAMVIDGAFRWTGQIAGFGVQGDFSYRESAVGADGIVRNDFESFNVSFFAPDGSLLRRYEDNHLSFPLFNFALDTRTGQILQEGTYNTPEGFLIGEGDPALRGEPIEDRLPGLAFWSRPRDDTVPHLHVDDWRDEFGLPIGFSSHEDVAFLTRTTAELLATGRVGDAYSDDPASGLDELGPRVELVPAPPTAALLLAGVVFLARRARAIPSGGRF